MCSILHSSGFCNSRVLSALLYYLQRLKLYFGPKRCCVVHRIPNSVLLFLFQHMMPKNWIQTHRLFGFHTWTQICLCLDQSMMRNKICVTWHMHQIHLLYLSHENTFPQVTEIVQEEGIVLYHTWKWSLVSSDTLPRRTAACSPTQRKFNPLNS